MALNMFACVGRMTADPELKYTPKGVAYLNFTLAVDKSSKFKKQTNFIRMTAWRGVAEGVSGFAKKGMMFMVEGDVNSKTNVIGGKHISQLQISVKTATVIGGTQIVANEEEDIPWGDEEVADVE